MAKQYTTIGVENDVLDELKNIDIDFYGINPTSNSDKIKTLMLLYKNNYKVPNQ